MLEKDEENQVYSYLYQKGYRVDQVKGLIAEGLFADYDDIVPARNKSLVQCSLEISNIKM